MSKIYKSDSKGMIKKSQERNNDTSKYPGLWDRIVEALGTSRQVNIANLLGITEPSVSQWKHGMPPSLDTLIKIAKLSNTTLDWLVNGSDVKFLLREAPGVYNGGDTEGARG